LSHADVPAFNVNHRHFLKIGAQRRASQGRGFLPSMKIGAARFPPLRGNLGIVRVDLAPRV
jgi:hypothetical protein